MNWLKVNRFENHIDYKKCFRPGPYQAAIQRYVDATKMLYRRLFDQFFTAINAEVAKLGQERKLSTMSNRNFGDRASADVETEQISKVR